MPCYERERILFLFSFLFVYGGICVKGRKKRNTRDERIFQGKLIKELKETFNGCIVLKNDPNYIQGIPDLLVLHKHKWAGLEVKKEADAHHQPNQDYYVDKMNKMSFARFIYPENKTEVLDELTDFFGGN